MKRASSRVGLSGIEKMAIMAEQNPGNTGSLLNAILEMELMVGILREWSDAERAVLELNKDMLEMMRKRSTLLDDYAQRVSQGQAFKFTKI